MWYLVPVFCLCAVAAQSQTLVAAKNLRAQSIIGPEDLVVMERSIPGTYGIVDDIIGMEARVTLYAGRPIRIDQIGPPAVIERNQIVTLLYRRGGLSIAAEARALGRAGAGDRLRVMNLASKSTVVGIVQSNGTVTVGGGDSTILN